MARKCRLQSCRLELPKVKDSDFYQRAGFCDCDCMATHGYNKAQQANERRRKAQEREARAEHRKAKEKLKTRRDYLRDAQAVWNRYVRARDLGKECASCGAMPAQKRGGTMDCSHYRSVGSAPHLRFHLHNAAAACVRCNRDLSGNIVELRKGLIQRIGIERVEAVERDNSIRRFDVDYLKKLIKVFRRKAAIAEKRYAARLNE